MSKRIALLVVLVAAVAASLASTAAASPRLIKGIYDENQTLYGNPDRTFPLLGHLRTGAVRVNLYWGGKWGASKRRPSQGFLDPDEPGKFNWGLYDRLVLYATQHNIRVVFSIYGTPGWANGGKGLNVPPTKVADLEHFARLAAIRYSGHYVNNDGRKLPPVRHWLAWNEPNNPIFLKTQYRRVGRKWVIQSARDYAKICNAVVVGVGKADVSPSREGQRVACGVTAPRGNNSPRSKRPSVSPLAFMRAMRAAGARNFDAYAHHPYPGRPSETPTTKNPGPTAIGLGNINVLSRELTRLWGPKLRLWITEYGYETKPHDPIFGVSQALQARYMTQAFRIARRHPRIDMMLWFMLRDERRTRARSGWQSGLLTLNGVRKPAFTAFRNAR